MTEPGTPAIEAAEAAGIHAEVVRTDPPASAADSAALQGILLECLIRTIVVRRRADDFVFVLVPGGRQIDWKLLRAELGVSRLSLPDADEARRVTGYERGAITPFGAATSWPVIADASIEGLDRVAIGGGARGVNLHMTAHDLLEATGATQAPLTRGEVKGQS